MYKDYIERTSSKIQNPAIAAALFCSFLWLLLSKQASKHAYSLWGAIILSFFALPVFKVLFVRVMIYVFASFWGHSNDEGANIYPNKKQNQKEMVVIGRRPISSGRVASFSAYL